MADTAPLPVELEGPLEMGTPNGSERAGEEPEDSQWSNPQERRRLSQPERRLDVPVDGYSWLKYGQKNIAATHKRRNYYRCSLWSSNKCPAKKTIDFPLHRPMELRVEYSAAHNHLPFPPTACSHPANAGKRPHWCMASPCMPAGTLLPSAEEGYPFKRMLPNTHWSTWEEMCHRESELSLLGWKASALPTMQTGCGQHALNPSPVEEAIKSTSPTAEVNKRVKTEKNLILDEQASSLVQGTAGAMEVFREGMGGSSDFPAMEGCVAWEELEELPLELLVDSRDSMSSADMAPGRLDWLEELNIEEGIFQQLPEDPNPGQRSAIGETATPHGEPDVTSMWPRPSSMPGGNSASAGARAAPPAQQWGGGSPRGDAESSSSPATSTADKGCQDVTERVSGLGNNGAGIPGPSTPLAGQGVHNVQSPLVPALLQALRQASQLGLSRQPPAHLHTCWCCSSTSNGGAISATQLGQLFSLSQKLQSLQEFGLLKELEQVMSNLNT